MSLVRRSTTRTHRFPIGHVSALALAAGGLSASLVVATSSSGAASDPKAKQVIVSVAKTESLGTILVSGRTLYTLKANKTQCAAQCLKFWPALLLPEGVTKAKAGAGVSVATLGTVKRTDGRLQVSYSGKALYYYVDDKTAGQVNGNDVTDTWGTWSVFVTVKPAAISVSPPATVAPTTPSTAPTSNTAAPAPTTSPTTPTTAPTTTTTPRAPTTTTTAPGTGGVAF